MQIFLVHPESGARLLAELTGDGKALSVAIWSDAKDLIPYDDWEMDPSDAPLLEDGVAVELKAKDPQAAFDAAWKGGGFKGGLAAA